MKPLATFRRVQVSLVREHAPSPYNLPTSIKSGVEIAELFRGLLRDDPREHFAAVYLDGRHQVIAVHTVSVGTADSVTVHPRDVFMPAVALCATALAVAHNHPSGDPTPSAEDKTITTRLRYAGELLGIGLLDHLVVGSERFYSFASEGYFCG